MQRAPSLSLSLSLALPLSHTHTHTHTSDAHAGTPQHLALHISHVVCVAPVERQLHAVHQPHDANGPPPVQQLPHLYVYMYIYNLQRSTKGLQRSTLKDYRDLLLTIEVYRCLQWSTNVYRGLLKVREVYEAYRDLQWSTKVDRGLPSRTTEIY